MNLDAYLRRNEIAASEFADQLGVSRQAVYHWLSGNRNPSRKAMRAIMAATDGKVTRRDFNGSAA